jgi:CHASE1-domain containing sensor protein
MILESQRCWRANQAPQGGASYSLTVLVGGGGVLVSVILALVIGHLLTAQAKRSFCDKADVWRQVLERTLNSNLLILNHFSGFFASSQEVERYEFETYAEITCDAYPTVLALEYAPCVQHSDRAQFEQTRTDAAGQPLIIRQLSHEDRSLVRSEEREVYFPVLYYYSEQRGNEVHGFDLLSEGKRLWSSCRLPTASQQAHRPTRHPRRDATELSRQRSM